MATLSNRERITRGFELLSEGLTDPVDEAMTRLTHTSKWNEAWAAEDAQKFGTAPRVYSKTDPEIQLRAITEVWRAFTGIFNRTDEAYATELRQTRNAWAHNEAFDSTQTARALETMELLLRAADAPDSADDVMKLKLDLQSEVLSKRAADAGRRKIFSIQPENGIAHWRDVITPRKEVLEGTAAANDFAANLYDVANSDPSKNSGDWYKDPVEFFARTYLTEGLRDLLGRAMRRLEGDNTGSAVVNLQTNFGGGKTHSLLALWHLFGNRPFTDFTPGIQDLAHNNGFDKPWMAGNVHRVAIVGDYLNTSKPNTDNGRPGIRTIWGELAWQLGGMDAYRMVRENDLQGTPPGAILKALVARYSPCLILIDEWVAYARQLVGRNDLIAGSFANQFTFAQALTEAVASTPHAMLVVSIPASDETGEASDIEIGGTNGQKALASLQQVITRNADPWRPSQRDESFGIVRQRLFETPDAAAENQIRLTADQFVRFYRQDPSAFPTGVTGNDYARRIVLSYPLHPELMDRLYGDWTTLPKFQRTRGVLKFVSSIIRSLWNSEDASPLILPGNIPLSDESVNTEINEPLPETWKSIIETDIDGEGSSAARLDSEQPVYGRRHLAVRLARTVFLGSAPNAGSPTGGLPLRNVDLGTAMPGDNLNNIPTALNQLQQVSTYLGSENEKYRYNTSPSLEKTVSNKAHEYLDDQTRGEVIHEITSRLRKQDRSRSRGSFARVCVPVNSSEDSPDTEELTLAILAPNMTYQQDGSNEKLISWVRDAVEQCGSSQRIHRNMVIFLAADNDGIASAESTAATYLAWQWARDSTQTLNLTAQQSRQVHNNIDLWSSRLDSAITEAYKWCLYPNQENASDTTYSISREKIPLHTDKTLAEDVSERLKRAEIITIVLNANMINSLLLQPIKSAFHDGVIKLGEVWDDATRYLYMPRLASRKVLDQAVEQIPNMTPVDGDKIAVAEGKSDTGRLINLSIPGYTSSQIILKPTDNTLLVQWDTALESLIEVPPRPTPHPMPGSQPGPKPPAPHPPKPESEPETQFYASVTLDPDTMNRQITEITDGILRLLKQDGGKLSLNLNINATSEKGFSETTVSNVKENTAALNIKDSGFSE